MEQKRTPEQSDAPRDADQADDVASTDDPSLSEYDKTIADSFPSSDPPAMP